MIKRISMTNQARLKVFWPRSRQIPATPIAVLRDRELEFHHEPTMTVGRLLFAAAITAYIFVGIVLEERDLVERFGDEYRRYRERVSMLVPWRKPA
jgi:hypothetical protein